MYNSRFICSKKHLLNFKYQLQYVRFYTNGGEKRIRKKKMIIQAYKAIIEAEKSENLKKNERRTCNYLKAKLQLCYDRNVDNEFRR